MTAQGKLAEAMDENQIAFRLEPDAALAHNLFAWALVLSPDRPRRSYDLGTRALAESRGAGARGRKLREHAGPGRISRRPLERVDRRWRAVDGPAARAATRATGFSWRSRTGRRVKRTRPARGSTRRLRGQRERPQEPGAYASSGRKRPSCCAFQARIRPAFLRRPRRARADSPIRHRNGESGPRK